MNRKLGLTAAVCVALGGAYATTSWWLGQQIQAEYRTQLDRVLAVLGNDKAVSVVSRSYERDLFSSRATLVLQFREPARPAPEPDMSWDDTSLLGSSDDESDEEDAGLSMDDGIDEADAGEAVAEDGLDSMALASAEDGESEVDTGTAGDDADEHQVSDETLSILLGDGTGEDESSENREEATPPKPPRIIRVHLAQELRHGPWTGGKLAAAAIETRIVRVEGLDEADYKAFAGARSPVLTTVHGFGNAISGQFRLPAGETKDPSDQSGTNRIHWETLSYDFELDGDRSRLSGQVSWPLLAASFRESGKPGGMTMTMRGWQARHEQQLNAGQWLMPPGTHQGTLSRLEMTMAPPSPDTPKLDVLLSDIRFHSSTQQSNGLVAAKQQVNGKGHVNALKFDSLGVEADIQRVDARVLAELQQLILTALNPSSSADAAPKEPDFEQMINRLLAASPELRERFNLTVGGETASLGYGVTVDPSIKASMDEMPGLASWANRLKVNASVSVPRSLVTTVASLVNHPELKAETILFLADMVAAQGYLKNTGTAWEAEAELKQGAVSVNGKDVLYHYGLGMLGGGMGSMDADTPSTGEDAPDGE